MVWMICKVHLQIIRNPLSSAENACIFLAGECAARYLQSIWLGQYKDISAHLIMVLTDRYGYL